VAQQTAVTTTEEGSSWTVTNAAVGEPITTELVVDSLALRTLSFTPSSSLQDVSFVARVAPEPASRPTQAVFQFIELEHPASLAVEDISLVVRVPVSWLAEQGLSPGDVAVLRFTPAEAEDGSGTWVALETSVGVRVGDEFEYVAQSPGLSLFAVSAKENAKLENTVVRATAQEPTANAGSGAAITAPSLEEPASTAGNPWLLLFGLPLAILAGVLIVSHVHAAHKHPHDPPHGHPESVVKPPK
jgi:PGF-pre-PGF domain-containing protein